MTQIDRRAFTPLYYQVEQELLRQIQQGKFRLGDQLPSEAQISSDFSVSRITVRRAISNLEQKGLVYTLKGKGTFVAEGRLREMSGFHSFSDDIRARGHSPSSRVVSLTTIDPPLEIQKRLRLNPGEQAFCLQRIRQVDGMPVAFETAYLPQPLCPTLDHYDLGQRSLFDVLRTEFNLYPTWADAEIDATSVDGGTAQHLGLQVGEPVLRALRFTYNETFEVIEYVVSIYCGEKFTFFTGRQYIGG